MPTQELGSSYCLLQMHKLSHKPKRKKKTSLVHCVLAASKNTLLSVYCAPDNGLTFYQHALVAVVGMPSSTQSPRMVAGHVLFTAAPGLTLTENLPSKGRPQRSPPHHPFCRLYAYFILRYLLARENWNLALQLLYCITLFYNLSTFYTCGLHFPVSSVFL